MSRSSIIKTIKTRYSLTISKKLAQARSFVGIDLLDHILIGLNAQYFSYNESSFVELKEFGKGYDVL
jgi:DNA repair protein RadC